MPAHIQFSSLPPSFYSILNVQMAWAIAVALTPGIMSWACFSFSAKFALNLLHIKEASPSSVLTELCCRIQKCGSANTVWKHTQLQRLTVKNSETHTHTHRLVPEFALQLLTVWNVELRKARPQERGKRWREWIWKKAIKKKQNREQDKEKEVWNLRENTAIIRQKKMGGRKKEATETKSLEIQVMFSYEFLLSCL